MAFASVRLTEEQIEAKVRENEAREAADHVRRQESGRARAAALRAVPFLRYQDVTAKPWAGGLLHGPAGTGKTREAVARLLSTPSGVFAPATNLADLARAVELDKATDLEAERFALFFSAEHLVVDDLGSRRPTEFAVEALYRIVDHRWSGMLETLVTSNFAPSQIAEAWGERIASRIAGFGKIEKITGRDWRTA